MRIVFFGSPATALIPLQALLDAGHDIPLIITQPDRPSGRGKKLNVSPVKRFAEERGIPFYQPRRIRKAPSALEKLTQARPDLNVVVAYGQILPDPIIHFPPHNSINIHFSLLPKYRGASPVQWALLNGEEKTGVTIFELNAQMDEGDIYSQREVDIRPEETAAELERRLADIGADLLISTIRDLPQLPRRPQDHGTATYAPLIKKEDGRIDWSEGAGRIANRIRAFTPWPSSFCYFRQKRLKITRGIPLPHSQVQASPGRVIGVGKEGVDIACGGGSIFRIQSLQPENKREMDAYSFSLGASISDNDLFD